MYLFLYIQKLFFYIRLWRTYYPYGRRDCMGRGKAFDHKKKGMERKRPASADQTKFPHEASTGHKTVSNEEREE